MRILLRQSITKSALSKVIAKSYDNDSFSLKREFLLSHVKIVCRALDWQCPNTLDSFRPYDHVILQNRRLFFSQVRYTLFRDRPRHERQAKFQQGCREGHVEVVSVSGGLVFGTDPAWVDLKQFIKASIESTRKKLSRFQSLCRLSA